MTVVAERLDAWLRYEHTKWELPLEPLQSWALTAGDDVLAAWEHCPRAEHLLALAGALGVRLLDALKPLGAIGRELLTLVNKKDHNARQLVTQCEQWRPPQKPRPPLGNTPAYTAVWKRIEQYEPEFARQKRLLQKSRRAVGASLKKSLEPWFDRLVTLVRTNEGEALTAARAAWARELDLALRELFVSDPAVAQWGETLASVRSAFAEAYALRAIGSLGVTVGSADQAMAALGITQTVKVPDQATVDAVFKIAERGSQRVFTEGAQVLVHAAQAHGHARAAGTDSIRTAIDAGLAPVLGLLHATGPLENAAGYELDEMLRAALQAIEHIETDSASRMLAEQIRAAIPRDVLLQSMNRATAFWVPAVRPSVDEGSTRRFTN